MSSGDPLPAQTTGYKGHGPTTIIVSVILGTIATLVVSGRLYLRFCVSKNSDPSDWFMLAGLVCLSGHQSVALSPTHTCSPQLFTLVYMIVTVYACEVVGLDWHAQYLDLPRLIETLKV